MRVPRFYRLLHQLYWRGAAVNQFLRRRLRPAGAGLVLLTLAAAVFGVGSRLQSAPQVFAVAVAAIAVAGGWVLTRRATLQATRELPRYATAGTELTYQVAVRNLARRPVRDAWLIETHPDPRPAVETFHLAREPGEEQRNWFDRTFAAYRWQWLLECAGAFQGGSSCQPLRLAAGASLRVAMRIRPLRRGVIRLGDLRVELPDPFGLVQRCRKVACPPATLTVLPRRFRVRPLVLGGHARFQSGGTSATNTLGQSGEFLGLRDYRAGDTLRQIHWRSWARLARPIVKELEETNFPRFGLVLDTFPPAGDAEVFEAAVSVAASYAAAVETRESVLDLMFIGTEAHHCSAGRGHAKLDQLLEVLAAVQAAPRPDFPALSRLVMRHREQLSACVCVLADWSAPRAELVAKLARAGVELLVLIVCRQPEPVRAALADHPPAARPHLVRLAHLQHDLLGAGA